MPGGGFWRGVRLLCAAARGQAHAKRKDRGTPGHFPGCHRGLAKEVGRHRTPGNDQGIIPHSNILFAIGAATRLINAARICGSLCSICIAFCSPCGFGRPCFVARSCHSCSQLDCWYFCTSRFAMASSIGYCCAVATVANSNAGTIANRKTCLIMICPRFFKAFSSDRTCEVRERVAHLGTPPLSLSLA